MNNVQLQKVLQLPTDNNSFVFLVKDRDAFKEALDKFCNGLNYNTAPETFPRGYPAVISFSWKLDVASYYIHIRCWEFEKDDFYILQTF